MGDSPPYGSIERLELVMAEREVPRLAGLLALIAMGLLVSDVAAGGHDAHEERPVIEEIQEPGTPQDAVPEPQAPKHVRKQARRHPVAVASPASRTSSPKAPVVKKHSQREDKQAAHAKVMAAAKHNVKMSKKKANAGKALKKKKKVVLKAKRHGILNPPGPKHVPHPHPVPGAPRGRTIKASEVKTDVHTHTMKNHDDDEAPEEEMVEVDADAAEEEDLDRQEAEDEKAAAQEELAEVDQDMSKEKSAPIAPTETPQGERATPTRTKHEKSTLAMIQSLRMPKPVKEETLTQAKYIDAKKYNIGKRAAANLNRIEDENADRADATEVAVAVDAAGLSMMPHLYHKHGHEHVSAFFKDHTWMIGASKSFGGFGNHAHSERKKAKANAARSVKDFAASDNKETSAMSLLSPANQKRVLKGKSPTKYLQKTGEERGHDKPHGHALLHPRFRSMRGLYHAKSQYQRYKKFQEKKAERSLDKLAGIKHGRFYDHDGDRSDSDAASGLLH